MLSVNKFQKYHSLDRSIKLLTDEEKETVLNIYYLYTDIKKIAFDDPLCTHLGAKEYDIICIRDNNSDVYRLVDSRNNLL